MTKDQALACLFLEIRYNENYEENDHREDKEMLH